MDTMDQNELRHIVGTNLRCRRKELDLTQAELAEKTGMTQPTIAAIEREKAFPSIQVLLKLAEILKTSPSALLAADSFTPASSA
jgi:transcriptional regulator with XRE-family HTH domain